MRVLASILCVTGMSAAAIFPAFAQRGAQWAGGWPRSAAIVSHPSAAFHPAPHIFQPAPHIYPTAPARGPIVEPGIAGPFHAPVMSRAYPGAAYPQSSYPRSAYPEGSRRDGQHHWRRSGRGWHSHRSNGWGGVGYQAPYFYSSSTYFVPSFWYPYGYNSFGSFLNDDDYDAFFNEQPSQEAYPAGYGPWDGQYSDGPGMEAPTAAAMPPLMNGPYREPYDEEGAGVVRQAPEVSAAPPPAIEPETPTQSTVAAAPEPQPATMLIFKDGRPAEKVYNYVITPTTIYSFHGNRREEIPVSSINVKATEAANRAAGVDFSLPSSADGL